MEGAQGGAALKERDVEEVPAPEGVERDFLKDLLDGVLFFERVGGLVPAQFFLDDVDHLRTSPSWPSSRFLAIFTARSSAVRKVFTALCL